MCASDFDEMGQFANVPICQRTNRQFALSILATWRIGTLANWQIGNLATWRIGNLAT